MKKLLVLSALLGLLALPVFANHVSFDVGGDHTFGFIGDFGDNETEKVDLTFDLLVGIDDYNSFSWSSNLDAVSITLDQALVTTDVGMWAGLPFGLVVNWGYDDPDANEFGNVTGYENTQVYDLSPVEYWGLDFLLSYNIIEVEVAFNPGVAGGTNDPVGLNEGDLLAGLAVKEPIPGLNAEVYYFQNQSAVDTFDQGVIAFGANYMVDVSGISIEPGVAFQYNLTDGADPAWLYGIGVDVVYNIIDATLGVTGMDGNALAGLDFTVDADVIADMLGLYAGAMMNFVDDFFDGDTFVGADLGAVAHVGAVDVYLGYLITSWGEGQYNADFEPAEIMDGGAYIKFDVDY
jgi:hypothetical protein